MKQAILKAVLFLAVVRLIAIPGYWLIYERFAPLTFIAKFFQSNFLLWSWANFDGEHYLSIAKYGYQIRNGFPQYAFFPLYPLLTKIVSFVVQDYLVAGLLVSFASLVVILRLLPQKDHLALFLAPGAIFLAAIYTEPLFIALALTVFYFSERKEWGRAAIVTALATATRVNGIFLVAFLFFKMIENKKLSPLFIIRNSLFSLSGLTGYMVYLYYRTGDALAWYHSQAYWGKATATSPFTTALSYFRAVTTEFQPDLVHLVVVFEVVITLWALFLTVTVIRRRLLSLPYYVYLLGNLVMPIATGSLGSMPRFFLILFPSYVAISTFSPAARKVVYTISGAIMITGVILFTRGHWFA